MREISSRQTSNPWAHSRRVLFVRAAVAAWFASSVALIVVALTPAPLEATVGVVDRVVLGRVTSAARESLSCHDLRPVVDEIEREELSARLRSSGFAFEERAATQAGSDFIVQIPLPESIELALLKREELAAREIVGSIEKVGEANVLVIGAFARESAASALAEELEDVVDDVSVRIAARVLPNTTSIRVFNASPGRLRGVTDLAIAPCPPVAAPRWFL